MKQTIEKFLVRHRGWVIFLTAVPLSFIYTNLMNCRSWFYHRFIASPKNHDDKVDQIRRAVRDAANSGKPMVTARKTWKTMSSRKATMKNDCAQISIDLRNILSLNAERGFVRVEPMMTMRELTNFLAPRGYALAVHVEMDDLTIGGLCMGVGIETSSHRFGFLYETILAYEIVMADGRLVRATADEHPELFYMLPWSHGTLGFLVAVELMVVPIKRYIKLQYKPFHSIEAFCREFERLSESEEPASYLEGLVFSKDTAVILIGAPSDGNHLGDRIPVNSINRWYKPWFYEHVRGFLKKGAGTELIPVQHYFHRHTPSVFFQLRDIIPFSKQAWYRYLFAWLGAPKVSLMKLTMTRKLRRRAHENRVAQDILIPMSDIKAGLSKMNELFEIYPLWVCPVRLFDHSPFEGVTHPPELRPTDAGSRMFVDLGVYGIPPAVRRKEAYDNLNALRALEHFTRSKRGFQMLYADILMTRKEFGQMFNAKGLATIRKKYNGQGAFPELYDKVVPEKWLVDAEEVAKRYPVDERSNTPAERQSSK